MAELPNEADIQRLLVQAAAQSQQNAGADEAAARSAKLKERSREMARLSVRFDMIKTVFVLVLLAFLAITFRDVFNLG
jgi:hypothetical protein